MGRPDYPDHKNVQELFKASELTRKIMKFERNGEETFFQFSIPPHGCALITLKETS